MEGRGIYKVWVLTDPDNNKFSYWDLSLWFRELERDPDIRARISWTGKTRDQGYGLEREFLVEMTPRDYQIFLEILDDLYSIK